MIIWWYNSGRPTGDRQKFLAAASQGVQILGGGQGLHEGLFLQLQHGLAPLFPLPSAPPPPPGRPDICAERFWIIWWYNSMMVWSYDGMLIWWYDYMMVYSYDGIIIWLWNYLLVLLYDGMIIWWYDHMMFLLYVGMITKVHHILRQLWNLRRCMIALEVPSCIPSFTPSMMQSFIQPSIPSYNCTII